MAAIILALMCAFSYGVADFWGGLATRRGSIWKVLPIIVAAGILTLLIALPFLGATFSRSAILAGIAAGLSGTVGYIFLMYGLALGPMSVVAPISAVMGSIIPFAVGLLRGETLSTLGFIGAGLALVSIVLVSRSTADATHPVTAKAVIVAIIAGLGIAGYFLGISGGPDDSGLAPVIVGRLVTGGIFIVIAIAKWKTIREGAIDYKLAIASGSLDVVGGATFMLATRAGDLVLVAVVAALYPAFTVLLARFILHERMERHQLIGLLSAGAAVALLASS
jgi:drug/metabolite transporter (DMT)-like permease